MRRSLNKIKLLRYNLWYCISRSIKRKLFHSFLCRYFLRDCRHCFLVDGSSCLALDYGSDVLTVCCANKQRPKLISQLEFHTCTTRGDIVFNIQWCQSARILHELSTNYLCYYKFVLYNTRTVYNIIRLESEFIIETITTYLITLFGNHRISMCVNTYVTRCDVNAHVRAHYRDSPRLIRSVFFNFFKRNFPTV